MALYLDPAGQGWTLEVRDTYPRLVLVERFALTATPTMLVREWSAVGLRDFVGDDGKVPAITVGKDFRLYVQAGYKAIPFERPGLRDGDNGHLRQYEEPIKPPRGKWRWTTGGQWQSLAKR